MSSPASKVPAQLLLALDRLEKSLEISFSEATASLPLNHLIEKCRPIFHRTREDLQHVAFIVAVHQYAEILQFADGFIDLADPRLEFLVIRRGHAQKLDPLSPQRRDCLHNISCRHRDVLPSGTAIKL